MENKYKKAVLNFSQVLNSALESEKSFSKLLDSLNEIINFDYGALFYVNADRLNLKADKQFGQKAPYSGEKLYFDVSEKTREDLYSAKLLSFGVNSYIAKDLELDKGVGNYILAKLIIRETIFGFILIAKFDGSKFNDDDREILNSFSSVAAYSIKDSELSNVFKLQLKALQESIVEKTQAYKTIKKQNEKILEADKAKNEFIANISHELRTPLNAIIGFSDVLKSKLFGDLNDKQSEYISDINASGVHLLGMINELLDLAKIEAKVLKLNKKDFSASQCINEVINIIRPLADKKHISVEKSMENDLMLNADYQKLQQILFNLLSNAIKFTPENGKVEIILAQNAKKTIIKVKDNGFGIDKKYQGKIFGKFVQLHSAYTKSESSTGLGLTITKELVELHGGKIYIESKVNEGSTFIIELPN
ncbi:MAG: ATP-binding protein [Candidatus Gastranaerophilales bacterium]|nr:ATP-binding protein [Candidatus Gastranaerophilales bacterium]